MQLAVGLEPGGDGAGICPLGTAILQRPFKHPGQENPQQTRSCLECNRIQRSPSRRLDLWAASTPQMLWNAWLWL